MTDVETPHLSVPFTLTDTGALVDEQDSDAELQACAVNTFVCPIGFREDLPGFGVDTPLFSNVPLDVAAMRRQVARWVPQATIQITDTPDATDPSERFISIEIQR